jgi:hypothetical protein
MNGIFTLSKENVYSALTYGVLAVVVTFIAVVGAAILQHGSIFGLNWVDIFDKGAIAVIGLVMVGISLLKNWLTNNEGQFLNLFKVIPDNTTVNTSV